MKANQRSLVGDRRGESDNIKGIIIGIVSLIFLGLILLVATPYLPDTVADFVSSIGGALIIAVAVIIVGTIVWIIRVFSR